MYNLELPKSPVEFLTDLCEERKKKYEYTQQRTLRKINVLRRYLLKVYREYEQAFADNKLEYLDERIYNKKSIKKLLWLYSTDLEIFKKEIHKLAKDWICPYCSISDVSTTEHFLPKSLFPEFAVLSYNLLPCCDRCNLYKKEQWREDSKLLFLNPYLSKLKSIKFLSVHLELNNTRPKIIFSLSFSSTMSTDLQKQIESHFERLKILERLNERGSSVLSDVLFDFKKAKQYGCSQTDAGKFIEEQADRDIEKFGVNYWKALIKKEVAGMINIYDILENINL